METKDYTLTKDGKKSANLDPITGAAGAHPVGTGLGAAAGGIAGGVAAGALAGTAVGPVGTIIGAAVGAIAGGLAGKGVAEMIDPTAEAAYWQENFKSRPYYAEDMTFDDYGPAYRYGVDNFTRYSDGSFETAEPDLARDWEKTRGSSRLNWESARHATRDSWDRLSDTIERAVPGDSDRDGK